MSEKYLIFKQDEAESLAKQGRAVLKDNKRIIVVNMGNYVVECFYNDKLKIYNKCVKIKDNKKNKKEVK